MPEGQKGGNPIDQLRSSAIQVALRTNLLKKCPIHGEVYDPGQHDYQGAFMVASFLINQGDPLVAPFKDDRSQLTTILKSICQSHASSCPQCSQPTSGSEGETSQPKPAKVG